MFILLMVVKVVVLGFFCVECKYLIVLSCFPGRVYIPITTGKIPEHMKCP